MLASVDLFHVSVALRKESVDRNIIEYAEAAEDLASLSARRAWIEMCSESARDAAEPVALRKESVDRNFHALPSFAARGCRSPQGERG